MISFQPNAADLQQTLLLLQALRDPLRADHALAMRTLTDNAASAPFALHVLHVFAYGAPAVVSTDLRQLAGLVAKNFVFAHLAAFPVDAQRVVRDALLAALGEPRDDALRNTAALLVARLVERGASDAWVSLFPTLLDRLSVSPCSSLSPTGTEEQGEREWAALDGALSAVKTLCEDCAVRLSLDAAQRAVERLLPRLLALLGDVRVSVRLRALQSYHALLHLLQDTETSNNALNNTPSRVNGKADPLQHTTAEEVARNASQPLMLHMNTFIGALAALSSDVDPRVRKCVCASLTSLVYLHIACLEPFFDNILLFMCACVRDADEEVAMECCEFWCALAHTSEEVVRRRVERALCESDVLGALVSRLTLTAAQMESERREEELQNSGRAAVNIKPATRRGASDESSDDQPLRGATEDDVSSQWTLRKQAALTLDTLCQSLSPSLVLHTALPHIQRLLQSEDELSQEAAILALGALAQGCVREMQPYWVHVLPGVLDVCARREALPELRAIACWVLGRYVCVCEMMVCEPSEDMDEATRLASQREGVSLYLRTAHALLQCMCDNGVRVQVAACSALCALAYSALSAPAGLVAQCAQLPEPAFPEDEQVVLSVALPALLNTVSQCFPHYGVKASLLLVDLVGCLADTLRDDFAQCSADLIPTGASMPAYQQALFGSFFAITEDTDARLFPYLECLTSLCAVCGDGLRDAVLPLYERCVRLTERAMPRELQPDDEDPLDMDLAVCALDVLAALCEGLSSAQFVSLLQHTQSPERLFSLALRGVESPLSPPALRQSALSLLGELCRLSKTHGWQVDAQTGQQVPIDEKSVYFTPASCTHILRSCVQQIDEALPFVCNNAAWCVGELVRRCQSAALMRPFTQNALDRLVSGLHSHELSDNLKVNLAITLCRLASVCTEDCALSAEDFLSELCHALTLPCPHAELRDAWRGLLALLQHTQELVLGRKTCMYALCVAALTWVESAAQSESERVRETHKEQARQCVVSQSASKAAERERDRAGDAEVSRALCVVLRAMQSHDGAVWARVLHSLANNGHDVQALAAVFAAMT